MSTRWIAIALLALGCGVTPTQIVVVVDSAFDPGGIDAVEITVNRRSSGPMVYELVPTDQPFPMTLGLSEFEGATDPAVEVTVAGSYMFTEIARREVRTHFVPGRSILLRIVLTPVCRTAMCVETCDEGGCTDVDIDPMELADFTGDLMPMCARRSAERCNAIDDDCDGMVDEDIDLMTDAENCGRCGMHCANSCEAGACTGGDISSVVAGGAHACGFADGGGVWCWGSGLSGQLGIGPIMPRAGMDATFARTSATPVPGLAMVHAMSAGGGHTCAIAGTAPYCWGGNLDGEVGDGTLVDALVPVPVMGLASADAIAAGGGHTCAIAGGQLSCWGRNERGQLGNGTMTASSMPMPVALPGMAIKVATGIAHTCAVIMGGAAYCWGANEAGQLGDGTMTDSLVPVAVMGLTDAAEIATGDAFTCAVHADGSAACWGANDGHQLGDGTTMMRMAPVSVLDVTGVQHVTASFGGHACAWGTGGAWCWGRNDWDQLGMASTMPTSAVAVPMPGPMVVAAGGAPPNGGFTCAVYPSRQIQCWGRNHLGELGRGGTDLLGGAEPMPVVGLP